MMFRNKNHKRKKFLASAKILFLSGLLLSLSTVIVPQISQAGTVDSILAGQICEPDENPATYSSNLSRCVNNIYIVSLAIAGAVAFFMFIIAGYLYTTGTEAAITTAKSILGSTFAALLILFGAFVILNTIDPEFTKIPNIKVDQVSCAGNSCDTSFDPDKFREDQLAREGKSPDDVKGVANEILQTGKIQLATVHASGAVDGATARRNIIDAANNASAARSSYGNAPGGGVVLDIKMLKALLEIGKTYEVSVSEIAGGSHSVNSAHYDGKAFDINYVNKVHLGGSEAATTALAQNIIDICRSNGATLAQYESNLNHVHCEW